jgi:hypothetical protein
MKEKKHISLSDGGFHDIEVPSRRAGDHNKLTPQTHLKPHESQSSIHTTSFEI